MDTTGFFAGLKDIDAGSGMFPNVRPSTFAAETRALAKATLRVLTARRYMADFGFPAASDNRGVHAQLKCHRERLISDK